MGLVCLATVVLAWVAPAFFRVASFLYIYLALFLFRHFGSGWAGLGNREISGNRVGVSAVYPVGFWQLAWVMIKINLFRWLSFSMIAGAACLLALFAMKADMNLGLLYTLKALALLLAIQPLFPIFAVTYSTTDGNSVRLIFLFMVFCGNLLPYCHAFLHGRRPRLPGFIRNRVVRVVDHRLVDLRARLQFQLVRCRAGWTTGAASSRSVLRRLLIFAG